MMPTSPSPSLKFRTAGFPRYGFKARLSGRAFPNAATVKPAPGLPASTSGLHQPFARFRHGRSGRALCPGLAAPPRAAVRAAACRSTPGALTRVRVLLSRSIIAYLAPSVPLTGTARFRRRAVYTRCLRCAGAPRRPPARPSLLSLPRCPCVPSTLRRWVRGPRPVVPGPRCQASSSYHRVATHEARLCQQSPTGLRFRRCIVRVMLRPACLPGPPGWLRRDATICLAPRLLRTVSLPLLTAVVAGRRWESG